MYHVRQIVRPLARDLSRPVSGAMCESGSGFDHLFTASPVLPTGFAFTRASSQYLWSPALGKYAPVANDVFATDYNPLDNSARGFRCEAAATNLALWSADISDAAWVLSASAAKSAATSIIQGGTAQKIEWTSGVAPRIQQSIGTYDGTTASLFVAIVETTADTPSPFTVSLFNPTDANNVAAGNINPTTGEVSAITGTDTTNREIKTYPIKAVGPNGGKVWLCTAYGIGPSGKARQGRVSVTTVTPSGPASLIVHYCAMFSGTKRHGSPIITGAASANRAACVLSMATLPSWFDQTKYAIMAEYERERFSIADAKILSISDGTANERVSLVTNATGGSELRVVDGGVQQCSITSGTELTGIHKVAASVTANQFLFARNGTGATEDPSGTMPAVSRIEIGSDGLGGNQLGGWVRKIQIVPRTMTQAELNTWSTQ